MRDSTLIRNPHDKAFRQAMLNPAVAREVFLQGLPAKVCKLVDWDTLQIEKDTFIDERFRYEMSDLLYSADMKDRSKGYPYLLCEHLSKPRKLMPFWILSYRIKAMKMHLEQNRGDKLPMVFPLVLYHGKRPYTESRELKDCFADPELAEKWFFKPHALIDLTTISDEDILKQHWASVMEMVMKHAFARDILPAFEKLVSEGIFRHLAQENGDDYVLHMVHYAINTTTIGDTQRFKQLFATDDAVGEKVMTIFQQFENEKREIARHNLQQGMQQGMQQGVRRVAENMLARGMAVTDVAGVTGLSCEEIEKLKS